METILIILVSPWSRSGIPVGYKSPPCSLSKVLSEWLRKDRLTVLLLIWASFLFDLRYVEGEHLRNCPPDTLDSGLQKLPLEYVYEYPSGLSSPGNWNTNLKTLKKLPTGEELKGTKSYETFMRFFTTFEITPEQLRERARARLNALYNSVRLYIDFLFYK